MGQTTTVLDPQLQKLVEDIDAIRVESNTLLDPLDNDQLNWRPAPEKWSVAECFEHLAITGEMLVQPLYTAIGEAREKKIMRGGPYRHGFVGKMFINSLRPGSNSRVKTPAVYAPTGGSSLDKEKLRRRFLVIQDQLRAIICEANGVDLEKVKVTSPAARLLKLNAATWLEATVVHEQRHLQQARRVIADPAFPAGAGR